MKNKMLNKNIEELNLDKILIEKLKHLNINIIEELWNTKKEYLKDNDFTNDDILQIKIKLQLIGLDLNKKKY